MSTPLEKVEAALIAAKRKGIKISAGAAAFDWSGSDNNVPITCSGFGALILFYNLRDTPNLLGVAREGWLKTLGEKLGVTGWWLRRFYCGFELGRLVHVKTSNKTSMYLIDAKGKKSYYKEDDVSKASIKLMKRYS